MACTNNPTKNTVVALGVRPETGKPNAFGEMYHVALTAIWFSEKYKYPVRIYFYQQDAGRIFLESLAIPFEEVEAFPKPNNKIHLPHKSHASILASFLFSSHGAGVMRAYAEKIRNLVAMDALERSIFEPIRTKIGEKILVWHRDSDYKRQRNSTNGLVSDLAEAILSENSIPVTINLSSEIPHTIKLGKFWKHLTGPNIYIKQLRALEYLHRECMAIGQIGMLSAAMDGPAFFLGLNTCYLERSDDSSSKRMLKFSKKLDGYRRVAFKPGRDVRGVFVPSCRNCPPGELKDTEACNKIRGWVRPMLSGTSSEGVHCHLSSNTNMPILQIGEFEGAILNRP